MNNVVLVHGGFVDGSGWRASTRPDAKRLQRHRRPKSYDVAGRRRSVHQASSGGKDGPAILVGHSYGGAVITEAGNDPKVTGLVYITAFAPDKGESVATLMKDSPPGAGTADIAAARRLFVPRQGRVSRHFRCNVDPDKAAFMADSQVRGRSGS